MTLSTPAPRRHMHTRRIHCEGFHRDDGLWDIEASVIDSKPFRYSEDYRGVMEPGSDVHNMAVRLTVGADLVVHAVEVTMPAVPHSSCRNGTPNYQSLVGARIGGGWRRVVQEAVGKTRGCTHVSELLFPMATVAYQAIFGIRAIGNEAPDGTRAKPDTRPHFIDGCIGWAAEGELVAELYPQYAKSNS